MKKQVFLVIFTAALFSCGEKSEPRQEPGAAGEEISQQTQIQPDTNTPGSVGTKRTPLAPSALLQIIPENIQGTRSLPPSSGEISEIEGNASTAMREFAFPSGGGMTITVTDYAANPAIVSDWKNRLQTLPAHEPGLIHKTIDRNGMFGHESWRGDKNGTLRVIAHDRYLIEIRSAALPGKYRQLEDLLSEIKISP